MNITRIIAALVASTSFLLPTACQNMDVAPQTDHGDHVSQPIESTQPTPVPSSSSSSSTSPSAEPSFSLPAPDPSIPGSTDPSVIDATRAVDSSTYEGKWEVRTEHFIDRDVQALAAIPGQSHGVIGWSAAFWSRVFGKVGLPDSFTGDATVEVTITVGNRVDTQTLDRDHRYMLFDYSCGQKEGVTITYTVHGQQPEGPAVMLFEMGMLPR